MNVPWVIELGREGARNLFRHKLRSTLTLLGVVFGVAAVISIMGIGEGAQRTVLREIAGLGLNNIIVDSVQPSAAGLSRKSSSRGAEILRYGLTEKDVEQIRTVLPGAAISVAHLVKQKVFYVSDRVDATVLGVAPEYFNLFRTELIAGAGLADMHERNGLRVAVLTELAARSIPALGGIIGKFIRIGQHSFEVIGVVSIPMQRGSGGVVYLPLSTARRLYGTTTFKGEAGGAEFTKVELGQAVINLEDEGSVACAAGIVERTLKQNHENLDYNLTVPLDLLKSKQRTQRILSLVLMVIAGISLLVGGIGIMNIMLAIVAERIPEIGVRRAIGASRHDILWQFLIETIVLSTAGGIIGCLLGFVAVPLASVWIGWPGVITTGAVLVSLAVSWGVGVVFGIAPALRAARLDPVDCLRHE
ncbi:MAG: ABC transporter permease [bacterium]